MGQQQSQAFPYEVGERRMCLECMSIWALHDGSRKSNGEAVSVFVLDKTKASEDEAKLARSSFFRLKTMKHPNILRYIDGVELDTTIYIVTERVVPLQEHLEQDGMHGNLPVSWGLHQIVKGLGFLNKDCGLCHNSVCMAAVFVDMSGEWKLGALDYLHPTADPRPQPMLSQLQKYLPPEDGKSGKMKEKWSTDMWGVGCLIWEVFNGLLPQASSLKSIAKVPKSLVSSYCELVSANPRSRPDPIKFLANCRQPGGFLANNFVDINLQLEEVQIMDVSQREAFLGKLKDSLDMFPDTHCKHKILPLLLQAFEYGQAGTAVLAPLFKLGRLLDEEEYQRRIVPCVVKLFSSTDRTTRIHLLQQLEFFVEHLQSKTVNDQIFPHVALGFGDTVAAMREHTVKSMLLLAPKLNEKTMNGQLLRHFAKLQMDEEPGIRTNTTVCLGKLAVHMSANTRQKVLCSAFLRSLRDPFPPARMAGVRAMAACSEYLSLQDIATRLLPALCTLTVDKEKAVRGLVFDVVKHFLGKLEEASKSAAEAPIESNVAASDGSAATAIAAAGSAASWAGWAVTSLTSKLYKGDGASGASGASGVKEARLPVNTSASSTATTTSTAHADRDLVQSHGVADDVGKNSSDLDNWDDDNWEAIEDSFKSTPTSTQRSPPSAQASSMGVEDGAVAEQSDDDFEAWEDDSWMSFDKSPPKPQSTVGTATSATATKNSRTTESRSSNQRAAGASKGTSASPNEGASGWGDADGWADNDNDWGTSSSKTSKTQQQKGTFAASKSGGMKLGSKQKVDKSPPLGFVKDKSLPTASSLFEDKKEEREESGWGDDDWGDVEKQEEKPDQKEESGWVDDDWGDLEKQVSAAPATTSSVSHQQNPELSKEQRREERRLKQQAAKERRAAGQAGKRSGLGGVKKLG